MRPPLNPDGRTGTVTVSVKRHGEKEIELSVADDGVGLSADIDTRDSSSFGLDLVSAFAVKLGGELTMESGDGPS